MTDTMISVEYARARIAAALSPVEPDTVAAPRAFGRTLSEDIVAPRDQPPAAVSAMDGYAVRSSDLKSGTSFRLVGESRAGEPFSGAVTTGDAVRISTGATVPPGADQVVIQENATRGDGAVTLNDDAQPGRHIRVAGMDFKAGSVLLPRGTMLTPPKVALVAAAGYGSIPVMRRPRIAILATGDELVDAGGEITGDQIANSTTPGLSALIFSVGAVPVSLGIARDDPDDIRDALIGAEGADLLVTVGGASVGDHDHLRRVFAEEGGEIAFEKVKVKPGKPTWFGRIENLPVLGLPGNPVSAMVTARLFLVPAIRTLLAQPQALALGFERAILAAPLDANGPRETYLRATRVNGATGPVRALDKQDSAQLSGLAQATTLIRRLPDAPALKASDEVEVLLL